MGVNIVKVKYEGMSFVVVDIELASTTIKMIRADQYGKRVSDFRSVIEECERLGKSALFATNVGICDTLYQSSGLYVDRGKYPLPTEHE